MASFGVALPIRRSSNDGFEMLTRFKTLIRQNLKMILLTAPGERIMYPEFGVGMRVSCRSRLIGASWCGSAGG